MEENPCDKQDPLQRSTSPQREQGFEAPIKVNVAYSRWRVGLVLDDFASEGILGRRSV
ncbi:MAG: hypothetical protein ACK5OB_17855 [Pirellula sp.]